MAKIKIISNPYKKQTSFEKWNATTDVWDEITINNNANSGLLSKELTTGFFPFVVQKIVDVIIAEYSDPSEKIEIEFEGTDDEYYEFQTVCKEEKYAGLIVPSRSSLVLENARDILEDIKDVFQKITPLIKQTVTDDKVDRDLARFTEASNDVIPICILGNYSSGKSSFINALVGSEILPSGDEPVTAKVYMIAKAKFSDRAAIKFTYDGEEVYLKFDENSNKFKTENSDAQLFKMLKKELSGVEGESITVRVNTALTVITEFVRDYDESLISDLIEIEIPFVGGIWSEIPNRFVIFDTPGSNSASNEKHAQVLKNALKDLSNGLPIYISEYNTLDSTDNEKLYQELASMEEIDSRFTMIVVNKADHPKLPKEGYFDEENENRLLSLATPRNLYSEGIYFVSSVMGLGSKCDGEFIDEHYAEMYESLEKKFSDPDSRFYKTLYRYNIMPYHLKKKSEEASAKSENLIYANSGLYAVEMEIATFAGKYSSYNKCEQSKVFLDNIITITADEIERKHSECLDFRKSIEANLERDKKELVDKLRETEANSIQLDMDAYDPCMIDVVKASKVVYDVDKVKEYEEQLIEQQEKNLNYAEQKNEAKESASTVRKQFVENIKVAFKDRSWNAFKEVGTGLMENVKEAHDNSETAKAIKKEAYSAASDALLQRLNTDYKMKAQEGYEKILKESKFYWETKAHHLREKLTEIVSGTQSLDREKKEQLTNLILTFENANFENSTGNVFIKENFEAGIRVFNLVIGNIDRLNLSKLTKTFNNEMDEVINRIYSSVEKSHKTGMETWATKLLDTIVENIVSYNPILRNQARIIKEEENKITELAARKEQLIQYTKQIEDMMDWKEY